MRLADAVPIADQIRDALLPFCERCEIAGSIRRRKLEVGDIEIVCIPRGRDLPAFAEAVRRWTAVKGKATGRYTQRRHPSGMVLDLFMATRENWGLIYAIRTGSARFSHEVLARGWVKAGYHSNDGRLYYRFDTKADPQVVYVAEERDLFALIGLEWVEPELRT